LSEHLVDFSTIIKNINPRAIIESKEEYRYIGTGINTGMGFLSMLMRLNPCRGS